MPSGVYERQPLHERFWSRVRKIEGCWLWTAAKLAKGYGVIRDGPGKGVLLLAHRLSWEIHQGPIPGELRVLHLCDNTSCVNPAHLFLGTQADNIKDCVGKGRHHKKEKTHCPKGHPYAGDNLYIKPNGGRSCRLCSRAARRRHKARRLKVTA